MALVPTLLLGMYAEGGLAAPTLGGLNISGSAGYNYRALTEDGGQEDTNHQLSARMNASNYFGEPWLATSNLNLSFTQDSSESVNTNTTTTVDSQIVTGDWGLNVLPQSKTPFHMQLQVSDSRVDREGTGTTPITFVGEEYSTTYLGLRQSMVTDNGGRYQARVDLRNWESASSGEYDDTMFGLEADLRRPRHHLIARGTMQNNEHSQSSRENDALILDLSHYYYPVRNLRFDTRANYYDYERSFLDPSSADTRLTSTNITQVSSYAFWRPADHPLSVSGGVRIYAMGGEQDATADNDVTMISITSGAFYQYNTNLRFDASVMGTFRDASGQDENSHRIHAGTLYQTDWREFMKFMHQGYADAAVDYISETGASYYDDTAKAYINADDSYVNLKAGVGHGLSRTWWLGERTSDTSVRLNLNEALRVNGSGAENVAAGTRVSLDHSVTTAFNQRAWGGLSLAQFTFSDSRFFGEQEGEQQLMNLQLSRDQDIGRRSSVSGDITMQYVRFVFEQREDNPNTAVEDFAWISRETDTTTTTMRVKFQHSRLFGVPRMSFVSELAVSKITTEGAIDREDWDNRVMYSIGKLDTSLSYRLTETDSRNYDLLYFRVMRRF